MIWAVLGALGGAVALVMLITAFKRGASLRRDDGALRILRDQLSEVSRDEARGLISPDEARAAEIEIKRRVLAVTRDGAAERSGRGGRWVLIGAAVLTPAAGAALYGALGAPTVQSVPFAQRSAERAEASEIADVVERLRTRLVDDPTGGPSQGWQLLGQSYMQMGRYRDAAAAYARLTDRDDAQSITFSQLAEALIAAEAGIITPAAERALDQALVLDRGNPRAMFYKSQALEQSGALGPARQVLIQRLRAASVIQPWMEIYVAGINRIGEQLGQDPLSLAAIAPDLVMSPSTPGPTAEDVEAASEMSDEDRNAFIRSMVERLAARLEDEPGDLEGWLRLVQAYTVLGDADAAARARGRAIEVASALPADDPARAEVLRQLGATE